MAEDKTPARKTMAPAARTPTGDDDPGRPAAGRDLSGVSDRELDDLAAAVQREKRRRARTPREPSFGMSEGERDELERTGRTVSPFTGEKRGDWPDNDGRPVGTEL